ncbi:ADP-ribosylation factor-like protein 5B, partial [Trichinella sp. T9]
LFHLCCQLVRFSVERKPMGLLVTKLWRWLFNNQEHKVIIVGLDNAGKTTILYHFLMDEVVHTSPTIGSNVEEVVWKNIHFLMWDIGGQDSLRASWNTYYTNTEVIAKMLIHNCSVYCVQIMFVLMKLMLNEISIAKGNNVYISFVILVIDSADRERLSTIKEEFYRMLAHEELRKSAVLIFANKQDIKKSMTSAEISHELNLTSIKDQRWQIQACCALTGEGLQQGLEWMASQIKR